jgi:hypothetical protein
VRLLLLLLQVGEAMASFERRLWGLARDYHALAQRQPRRLVDVARVVEMQQQVRERAGCEWQQQWEACNLSVLLING